jgi:hypothetical protein
MAWFGLYSSALPRAGVVRPQYYMPVAATYAAEVEVFWDRKQQRVLCQGACRRVVVSDLSFGIGTLEDMQ